MFLAGGRPAHIDPPSLLRPDRAAPCANALEAFLADTRPDAYERLIDRLLASVQYGERWARHWLDVAGYADSDGYTAKDVERRFAYKYRDYVIRSMNAGRPWDELIQEQLAGDEMVTPPYKNLAPANVNKLVATGFLRMAPDGTSDPEADQPLARNDTIAGTIQIVSGSLLGLTVACAMPQPSVRSDLARRLLPFSRSLRAGVRSH